MAYEKVQLVVASVSGDVYLARVDNNGIMSTSNRRVATDDVLRATTEWFIKNKRNNVDFGGETPEHTLFYTNDADKRRRILAILNED